MNCEYRIWFFEEPSASCPSADPVASYAAAQHFERGGMFWIEETDTIYAFYDIGLYDDFYSVDPTAENGDYEPPDGLYEPERGLV